MNYSKIELMQIEKGDLQEFKNLLNALRLYLPDHRELSNEIVNEEYEIDCNSNFTYLFSVRGLQANGYSCPIIGFAKISKIDWISGNAEINFIMYGDGISKGSFPQNEISLLALKKLIDFCFDEIGLQKIYIEVIEGNDIKPTLEQLGFVAEGVKRRSWFKKGKFVDSTICSLLMEEYKENI